MQGRRQQPKSGEAYLIFMILTVRMFRIFERVAGATGTLTAVVRRRAINSHAYASVPYHAARMLNQLRRGHRAWPMFELKSGVAMAAPAAPMPPPLNY